MTDKFERLECPPFLDEKRPDIQNAVKKGWEGGQHKLAVYLDEIMHYESDSSGKIVRGLMMNKWNKILKHLGVVDGRDR